MSDAMKAGTVMISGAGGDEIEAYLAEPVGGPATGGVVVIHHMPGYDAQTKEITRNFAAHGYLAICPNLYWREAPGAHPDDAAATARAAARSIPSVTARASAAIVPRPRPGKTNTLFAWATSRLPAGSETGGNGEPVATRARPSVQPRTLAGVASDSAVGLESGRTIGRWSAASDRITASVKAPATAVVPTRIVGRMTAATSSRETTT